MMLLHTPDSIDNTDFVEFNDADQPDLMHEAHYQNVPTRSEHAIGEMTEFQAPMTRSLLKMREKMNISKSATEYIVQQVEELVEVCISKTTDVIAQTCSKLSQDQTEEIMNPLRNLAACLKNLNF
jgi:hypothetical protein